MNRSMLVLVNVNRCSDHAIPSGHLTRKTSVFAYDYLSIDRSLVHLITVIPEESSVLGEHLRSRAMKLRKHHPKELRGDKDESGSFFGH
jgi:hypothetical protein